MRSKSSRRAATSSSRRSTKPPKRRSSRSSAITIPITQSSPRRAAPRATTSINGSSIRSTARRTICTAFRSSRSRSASRGQGAQLDGRRIRVSKRTTLQQSLIGTGFPYRANLTHIERYLGMLKAVMLESAGVRRPGSAALDLCYVAAGRVDAFFELGLSKWDIAAGALIIREAGGRISDFHGGDGYLDSGNVVAGNPKVYAALSKLLAPFSAGVA